MPNDKLSSLTLKEKATMLSGHTNMTTFPIPEKGIIDRRRHKIATSERFDLNVIIS